MYFEREDFAARDLGGGGGRLLNYPHDPIHSYSPGLLLVGTLKHEAAEEVGSMISARIFLTS